MAPDHPKSSFNVSKQEEAPHQLLVPSSLNNEESTIVEKTIEKSGEKEDSKFKTSRAVILPSDYKSISFKGSNVGAGDDRSRSPSILEGLHNISAVLNSPK